MTVKLYYEDPYIKSFSADILKAGTDVSGRSFVILDQTAFYPGGGGQPCDLGEIDGIPVTEVQEDKGQIIHFLDRSLSTHQPTTDQTEVRAMIDWQRRFDHMQQHAGQHILSAAFDNEFGLRTIGFHLGQELVTIDLDVEQLEQTQVKRAEALANQIIFENHQIETKWVNEEEASRYPLRKALAVTNDIRLVIIDQYDYNGCGGTHPAHTSEVGLIKILTWERERGHTRLTFVCGGRVLNQMEKKQNILIQSTQLFKTNEALLPTKIEQTLEENKHIAQEIKALKEQITHYEVKEMIQSSKKLSGFDLVGRSYTDRSMKELQSLSQQITANDPKSIVCLVTKRNGTLQFVCGRGTSPELNMKELSNVALKWIDGKGGGSPERVQGGATHSMSEEAFLEKLLQQIEVILETGVQR